MPALSANARPLDPSARRGGRTWFVSRHPGARDWACRRGLRWDAALEHTDGLDLRPGDRVMGTLPCHLAAIVCAAGAEYWHLEVPLPREARGQELSADELEALGARLVRLDVRMFER
jgi:CRISPR-associated protein Csx16